MRTHTETMAQRMFQQKPFDLSQPGPDDGFRSFKKRQTSPAKKRSPNKRPSSSKKLSPKKRGQPAGFKNKIKSPQTKRNLKDKGKDFNDAEGFEPVSASQIASQERSSRRKPIVSDEEPLELADCLTKFDLYNTQTAANLALSPPDYEEDWFGDDGKLDANEGEEYDENGKYYHPEFLSQVAPSLRRKV